MAERYLWYVEDDMIVRELLSFVWAKADNKREQRRLSLSNLSCEVSHRLHKIPMDISTASNAEQGVVLSAFNLKFRSSTLESFYQGSKIFENGRNYPEVYNMSSLDAKQYPALKKSGAIVGFTFDNVDYPAEPKSVFYDWLYVKAVLRNFGGGLDLYPINAFVDIQSPITSIACQARALAIYVLLKQTDCFELVNDFEAFRKWHIEHVEVIKTNQFKHEDIECLKTTADYTVYTTNKSTDVFREKLQGTGYKCYTMYTFCVVTTKELSEYEFVKILGSI